MDVQAYLDRIKYEGPLTCDQETLNQLHLAHLLHVPFENLSIHALEPIVLNDVALFEKIVTRRRGGFCYELNGLFAALLRKLSRDFDHMTLMVSIKQERWLADVGFGDSFIEPLLLDSEREESQRESRYRIICRKDRMLLEQAKDSEWKPQYRFSLIPYQYADYLEMCRYHQTSPDSHFTRQRICSRLTTRGRISLSDMRFIVTEDAKREERLLTNQDEYSRILREHFGIVM